MIIAKPWLCTRMEIWQPKYHVKDDPTSWEVWLSKSKVSHASPVIIIEFTKAKHLRTQRFCIRRQDVERSEQGTNGRIPVYKVDFNKLEGWDTAQEVHDLAMGAFND